MTAPTELIAADVLEGFAAVVAEADIRCGSPEMAAGAAEALRVVEDLARRHAELLRAQHAARRVVEGDPSAN